MWVKLWNKAKDEYEIIKDADSIYWFSDNMTITCGSKKTAYDTKVYDMVAVSKSKK